MKPAHDYPPMNKFLFPLLAFWSSSSYACVVGPINVTPKPELGFEFQEEQSELCRNCSKVSVNSPIEYVDRPASHAVFSVFFREELVSKSVTPFRSDSEKSEFVAIVSKEQGFRYEINVDYGTGRCMKYRFSFLGSADG